MRCYRGSSKPFDVGIPDFEQGQICNKAEEAKTPKEKKRSKVPKWIKKIHDHDFLERGLLLSCVLSIAVDPLFFYLPVINEERKCVVLDKRLYIISTCLRTVLDSISLVNIILQCLDHLFKDIARSKAKRRYFWLLAIEVPAILPIPQVLLPNMYSKMKGSQSLSERKVLTIVVLFPYLPRVLRIYPSWYKVFIDGGNKRTRLPKGVITVNALFNLLLYIVASHVLGGIWYFFSIERETTCWHLACEHLIECDRRSYFDCNHAFGNQKFLNDSCPVENQNTTAFDFGIFQGMLQSGIVASMDFPRKILYCFWWGLRNLSSFGSNLQTSPYFWENGFAVLTCIFGLILFMYFLGNLQVYMQWEIQKQLKTYMDQDDKARMTGKEQSVELWIHRNMLRNVEREIMRRIKPRLQENDNNIDAENPFPHLPILLKNKIKRSLCFPILRNVPMFQGKREKEMSLICTKLKHVYYSQDSYIIREGEPLDRMLLIVKGIVWKFTSDNGGGSLVSSMWECAEKGDYFGEEILVWGFNGSSQTTLNLSHLPICDKTLKTHTNVEAFVLMANDLKDLVSWSIAPQTPSQAAQRIQQLWRRNKQLREWKLRAKTG